MTHHIFITAFVLVFSCIHSHAQLSSTLTTLPKVEDIKGIEYIKPRVYGSGCVDFRIPKEELFNFIQHGKILPFNSSEYELAQLAPFTPSDPLSDVEQKRVDEYRKHRKEDWQAISTTEFGSSGAFTTADHQIYFWCKINDRVLLVHKWTAGCYLLLPESPAKEKKTN